MHTIRHSNDVSSRTFDGETVIVNTSENVVTMLNEVGSRIWELADGSQSIDEIVTQIVGEYNVELADAKIAVERFVQELETKGLVIAS